jgi:starch-binding outer membrane protein, SusD/RagB family
MKNRIINISTTLLLSTLILSSCEKDKLDPVPQTVLSDASAFSSADRILQQVYGVYSAVKSGNFLGGRTHVYNDVRGEDWLNVTGNGVTALGAWNFSLVSSDNQVEGQWSAAYAAINRANVTIEGIAANPTVISPALAIQYTAEARFCRALCYHQLLQFYARKPFTADNGASLGVPLRLTAAKGSAGADLKRSTVAEVYAQIIADLNFAETNLPATYATADQSVIRAHKNAAIAYKTRVYLTMGKNTDVISEANKLVNATAPFAATSGVLHKLAASFSSVFRASYNDKESIFSLPMANTNSPGTQNGLSSYHNAEFSLNPNGILANTAWKAADSRRALVTGTSSPFRYSKFNDDLTNYVPIIRYSEVMLNLAEALAREATGVDARAVALLNAVRQRADATTTFAPATKTDLIDLILTERRIEFLGEGLRSIDIYRQNIDFPAKGSVGAVPASTVAYVWPIPASEILYNKLCTPNQ